MTRLSELQLDVQKNNFLHLAYRRPYRSRLISFDCMTRNSVRMIFMLFCRKMICVILRTV